MKFGTWHSIRRIFLIAGIVLAIFAYSINDVAIGLFSVLLIYQAILNVGCVKMCYAWQTRSKRLKKNDDLSDEVSYEEIL